MLSQVQAPGQAFVVQSGDVLGLTNEQDICPIPRASIDGYLSFVIQSTTNPEVNQTYSIQNVPFSARFAFAVEIDPSKVQLKDRCS